MRWATPSHLPPLAKEDFSWVQLWAQALALPLALTQPRAARPRRRAGLSVCQCPGASVIQPQPGEHRAPHPHTRCTTPLPQPPGRLLLTPPPLPPLPLLPLPSPPSSPKPLSLQDLKLQIPRRPRQPSKELPGGPGRPFPRGQSAPCPLPGGLTGDHHLSGRPRDSLIKTHHPGVVVASPAALHSELKRAPEGGSGLRLGSQRVQAIHRPQCRRQRAEPGPHAAAPVSAGSGRGRSVSTLPIFLPGAHLIMKQLLQKYTAFGARLPGSGRRRGPRTSCAVSPRARLCGAGALDHQPLGAQAPLRLGRQSPPAPAHARRPALRSDPGTKALRTAPPAVPRRPAPASGRRQTRLLVTPGYAELPWRGSNLEARGPPFPPPRA